MRHAFASSFANVGVGTIGRMRDHNQRSTWPVTLTWDPILPTIHDACGTLGKSSKNEDSTASCVKPTLSGAMPCSPLLATNARNGAPRAFRFANTNDSVRYTPASPGPPSITVSALSRDTWTGEGFLIFPSWKVLGLRLLSLISPRLAFRILQWNLVPPTIYPVTCFRS